MTGLNFETVDYDEKKDALVIIDQTKLPGEVSFLSLTEAEEIWEAIYLLKVRGAPAIGVAAAFGLAAVAERISAESVEDFFRQLKEKKEYLNSSRPTAVNLSWALERLVRSCEKEWGNVKNDTEIIRHLKECLKREAFLMKKEDIEVCRKIGENGLSLLKKGDGILTHCNAGQLATCKYGTATAPLYIGQEKGYDFKVYADETRPLLQGARLTAFELASAGIDVTLLCDNMAASLMAQGNINAVLVGCDRVAANGDTANKIGTSAVAILANYYQIPFYVCAPFSTIDFQTKTGAEIPIEQREETEVTTMWYQKKMTADGVKVYNPAFDVTDHSLITAFITEKGVIRDLGRYVLPLADGLSVI
ncbi:MAG: S-methyl-5-thioribose-1-phosphate isomerase [Lachnospiraceae bacterium]|nr:S-methyl-5-thioribose-1-phosphate isomerase [Lachnospiraceae bacterium]